MSIVRQSLCSLPFLIVLLLLFGGCGDSAGDSSNGDGKTEIRFWHFWSEPTQKAHLMQRVKEFAQAHPDIIVRLEELSWDQGEQKLLAAFNAATNDPSQAPDVIELGSDWVAKFSSAGVLAELSAMSGDSTSRFSQDVLAPGLWEGKVYAWPWIIASRALFVNRGLLAESGFDTSRTLISWSDVMDAAERVNGSFAQDDPARFGFGANGPDRHRLYKKILPFFWSNGGKVLDENGNPVVSSPQNLEALQTYLALARAGKHETQKQLDAMFLQGKVAFWISGPWLVDRIAKDSPDLNFAVTQLPGFGDKPGIAFAGGEYLAISTYSEHKEAAWKLIKFLTSPEQALAFGKELPGGFTPADLSVADNPALQEGWRKVFTAQAVHARMTPVHPKWLEIEEILEDEVTNAILGQKEAEEALKDAQFRIAELVTS